MYLEPPSIPTFSGGEEETLAVEDFERMVKAEWEMEPSLGEKGRWRLLRGHVQSPARDVLEMFFMDTQFSSERALQALVELYGDQRDPETLLLALLDIHQFPGERLVDLMARVQRAYQRWARSCERFERPGPSKTFLRNRFIGAVRGYHLTGALWDFVHEAPQTTFWGVVVRALQWVADRGGPEEESQQGLVAALEAQVAELKVGLASLNAEMAKLQVTQSSMHHPESHHETVALDERGKKATVTPPPSPQLPAEVATVQCGGWETVARRRRRRKRRVVCRGEGGEMAGIAPLSSRQVVDVGAAVRPAVQSGPCDLNTRQRLQRRWQPTTRSERGGRREAALLPPSSHQASSGGAERAAVQSAPCALNDWQRRRRRRRQRPAARVERGSRREAVILPLSSPRTAAAGTRGPEGSGTARCQAVQGKPGSDRHCAQDSRHNRQFAKIPPLPVEPAPLSPLTGASDNLIDFEDIPPLPAPLVAIVSQDGVR